MPREIDYNKIDVDVLDEIDEIPLGEKFKKIKHKKRFDDGTLPTKNPKKKKDSYKKTDKYD